jgi:hypothetical protein
VSVNAIALSEKDISIPRKNTCSKNNCLFMVDSFQHAKKQIFNFKSLLKMVLFAQKIQT